MSNPSPAHDGAGRLRGATSSPVRDILALTERPGVISFAGGLPAPDLFDRAGLQAAFTAVLAGTAAPARCSTPPRRAIRSCAG